MLREEKAEIALFYVKATFWGRFFFFYPAHWVFDVS